VPPDEGANPVSPDEGASPVPPDEGGHSIEPVVFRLDRSERAGRGAD
jgi:hypothetical protein